MAFSADRLFVPADQIRARLDQATAGRMVPFQLEGASPSVSVRFDAGDHRALRQAIQEATQAGSDEVGRLSVAFDQMRRDLKHREQDLDFLRGAQDAIAAQIALQQAVEMGIGQEVAL